MATYLEWNAKLCEYITSGLPQGSKVYLSIDDEVLEKIGQGFNTEMPERSWAVDFEQAIRYKCVSNRLVRLDRIFAPDTRPDYSQPPRYLAFLCAMALAAHRMHYDEDQNVENTDYFSWFNAILGLTHEGRPPGLENGAEEPLWHDWAAWLRANGYLPSAQKTGVTYITYAISQALLRQTDKDALQNYFFTHNFPSDMMPDRLMQRLRMDALGNVQGITKHLQTLLRSDGEVGAQRYNDLVQIISDVYDEWVQSGGQEPQFTVQRQLAAGLYRVEDPITRRRQYHLFPRQPRHVQIQNAVIRYEGYDERLIEERPGWFAPLWAVTAEELSNGITATLEGAPNIRQLVLPHRDFWILTPNNDDPDSGIYASWDRRPELGTPFVLLCKAALQPQVQHLKDEGLIEWHESPLPVTEDGSWVEFYGITVISDGWKGVEIDDKGLYEQLYPHQTVGISLRGGMRDPHSSSWLEGYGPALTVFSFEDEVNMRVLAVDVDEEIEKQAKNIQIGKPIDLAKLPQGVHRIEIFSSDTRLRTRELRIVGWDRLAPGKLDLQAPLDIGKHRIFGTWISSEHS